MKEQNNPSIDAKIIEINGDFTTRFIIEAFSEIGL